MISSIIITVAKPLYGLSKPQNGPIAVMYWVVKSNPACAFLIVHNLKFLSLRTKCANLVALLIDCTGLAANLYRLTEHAWPSTNLPIHFRSATHNLRKSRVVIDLLSYELRATIYQLLFIIYAQSYYTIKLFYPPPPPMLTSVAISYKLPFVLRPTTYHLIYHLIYLHPVCDKIHPKSIQK